MSTLDDLRSTLAVHAPVEDADLLDRAGAVRSRVRVVRRRRRVSAALGAVAAVALVAVGIAVPRLTDRTPDVAASTITVTGFEYRLARTVESQPGQKKLTITVSRRDAGQAIALTADGLGDGSATMRSTYVDPASGDPIEGTAVDRIQGDGTNQAVPLPTYFDDGAAELRYTIRVEGGTAQTRVGVAFYERTHRMPAGVVDPTGKLVYREEAGARRLVKAAFAKPGQAEVTLTFSGRLDTLSLDGVCSLGQAAGGGDQPRYVNISVDGAAAASWTGCTGPTTGDAGSGGFVVNRAGTGEHTMRVWASEKESGPPQAYDGVVLGGAVYDDSAAIVINGNRIDPVVEYDGRTWELDRGAVTRSAPGRHSVTARMAVPRPVLVGYAADHVSRVDVSFDGEVSNTNGAEQQVARNEVPGASSSLGSVALPGAKAAYHVSWPAADTDGAVAILVYRLRE